MPEGKEVPLDWPNLPFQAQHGGGAGTSLAVELRNLEERARLMLGAIVLRFSNTSNGWSW